MLLTHIVPWVLVLSHIIWYCFLGSKLVEGSRFYLLRSLFIGKVILTGQSFREARPPTSKSLNKCTEVQPRCCTSSKHQVASHPKCSWCLSLSKIYFSLTSSLSPFLSPWNFLGRVNVFGHLLFDPRVSGDYIFIFRMSPFSYLKCPQTKLFPDVYEYFKEICTWFYGWVIKDSTVSALVK